MFDQSKSEFEQPQPEEQKPATPGERLRRLVKAIDDDKAPTPPNRKTGNESTLPPPSGVNVGTPLPLPAETIDKNATQVMPAAFLSSTDKPKKDLEAKQIRYGMPHQLPDTPVDEAHPTAEDGHRAKKINPIFWRRSVGCLLRSFIALLFGGIFIVVAVISVLVFQYFSIAWELRGAVDLRQHASQFETTRILDRNDNVLYEVIDPNAGKRTQVSLSKISPYLIAATIATEDKNFYNNPGFDPIGILRALWQNYTSGEVVSGASTITQQLARNLLLSPEERAIRTVQRKAREIVLAAEITRKYSKDVILELYLNENNYGNLAYGIEAAAEVYFNTSAEKLTLSQSTFLAGIPQAPGVYDIFSNRIATLERQKQVLVLMYQLSSETTCIFVSTQKEKICVNAVEAIQAAQIIETYDFSKPNYFMLYPHWVNFIRMKLEEQFDLQTIYRSGFRVYTTLDPEMQDMAENLLKEQVENLADRNVTDGALVAIHPGTGEILAMVGSADFYNEKIAGQVNMAISPRQPGSAIKPLTYIAAFEKGWTPATLLWDVPSEFPPSGNLDDTREPYKPINYDERFHGPVTVRSALANSYNIPAVKTLQFVGIYDNPQIEGEDGLINLAKRLGITTLDRIDYGLSLTLGGVEVTLLEMTSVYATIANNGKQMPLISITRIEDRNGNIVFESKPHEGKQVIREEHAYFISSILSDPIAREPMFGSDSILTLPFQAAVKTGTTNDYRDNWTLGYTPDVAVGVWVGNADYSPMKQTTGLTGAAPIWSAFMKSVVPVISGGNPTPFKKPKGIVERVICSLSGTEPSEWCQEQQTEIFASDQPPLSKEQDLWQKVKIDTWTALLASFACSDFVDEKMALNVQDPWARKWLLDDQAGQIWLEEHNIVDPVFFTPERACNQEDAQVKIIFPGLEDFQSVQSDQLDIYAIVDSSNGFKDFVLEYGKGDNPSSWKELAGPFVDPIRDPERIYSWDLRKLKSGGYTIRIYLTSDHGTYAEKRIHLNLLVPTATPTDTCTPTEPLPPTDIPTDTPAPSETPEPTETPMLTDSPSP
jgi:penicillin-binding protein 1C